MICRTSLCIKPKCHQQSLTGYKLMTPTAVISKDGRFAKIYQTLATRLNQFVKVSLLLFLCFPLLFFIFKGRPRVCGTKRIYIDKVDRRLVNLATKDADVCFTQAKSKSNLCFSGDVIHSCFVALCVYIISLYMVF